MGGVIQREGTRPSISWGEGMRVVQPSGLPSATQTPAGEGSGGKPPLHRLDDDVDRIHLDLPVAPVRGQ